MKRIIPTSFGFVLLLTLLFSCKKIDKFTQFEMDFQSSVTIRSSSPLSLPFNLITPEITTNSETTFSENDTNEDLVESIILQSLDLEVQSPSTGTFGFLNSIEIFLKADGMSEQRIAWKENIPDNQGRQLTLETSSEDLREYLIQDSFSLRVSTVTDEAIATDHEVLIDAVFFVDAKILGL